LLGTATRLAAARREQRFAALRLVGATPRQVSVISAVESTVAAAAGVAVGFVLFLAFRGPASGYAFTGERFRPGDMTLGWAQVLLVALGVPVASAVAARIALRRVRISPLGVHRRVTPPPPRWYRVLPLLLGVAELGYFVGRRPPTTNGQIAAYLPGFVVVMARLIVAGPWLTMVGARVMARRTGRPAVLIAGRRLADNPRAGFRAISGLVLALFVTTTAVVIIATMVANDRKPDRDPAAKHAVVDDFSNGRTPDDAPRNTAGPVPEPVVAHLRAVPGVTGVALVHTNPVGTRVAFHDGQTVLAGLVSCARLAELSGFGRCAPGAEVAAVYPDLASWDDTGDAVWAAAPVSADELRALPVQEVVMGTDGSQAAVERARSALTAALPGAARIAQTMTEQDAWASRDLARQKQLAVVVILVSFPIAACGLAVSVAAGLGDRKRPFSLLRLTGVPPAVLRRVVALESAVPLLVSAAVATGAAFLASQLFVRSQLGYSLHAPGTLYYVTVAAGLAVAMAIICSTLPLLERLTGPETARNE
ncbi:MAG: ABC transporter permease, partial [Streptomycetaceae bacterium]|nr:ABC transporter permease [Streptomycetaceae bacterium]